MYRATQIAKSNKKKAFLFSHANLTGHPLPRQDLNLSQLSDNLELLHIPKGLSSPVSLSCAHSLSEIARSLETDLRCAVHR